MNEYDNQNVRNTITGGEYAKVSGQYLTTMHRTIATVGKELERKYKIELYRDLHPIRSIR